MHICAKEYHRKPKYMVPPLKIPTSQLVSKNNATSPLHHSCSTPKAHIFSQNNFLCV